MKRGTPALAALTLVASLGLVIPGTWGGSASADVSPNNPQSVKPPPTLDCLIKGQHVLYDVVSTHNANAFQATRSSTVFNVISQSWSGELIPIDPDTLDVRTDLHKVPLSGSDAPNNPDAKRKGRQAVVCTSDGEEYWTDESGEYGPPGVYYHGVYLNTWNLAMSGPGVSGKNADRSHHQKSSHHGGGKHRH
jgi:hypothetical protein